MSRFRFPIFALPSLSKRVLVFHSDGFSLSGLVAELRDGRVNVLAEAHSRAVDHSQAVGEIKSSLQGKVGPVPRRAALSTPSAVVQLLELPVHPSKPRSDPEMTELIRWELESVLAEQAELWVIGAVLQGRGYITAEQRLHIAQMLATATGPDGGRSMARFGELAVEQGYVDRTQLEECLRVQERLAVVDEDVLCHWQPQTVKDAEGGEYHAWLACAMGRSARDVWTSALQRNGLKLTWIYPSIVGGALSVSNATGQSLRAAMGEVVVLDLHADQMVSARLAGGVIAGLRVGRRPVEPVTAAQCADLMHEHLRAETERIVVHGGDAGLVDELSARLGRQVVSEDSRRWIAEGTAAHMLGVARDVLGVRIAAHDPSPPMWRNVTAIRAAAVFSAIAVTGGTETYLRMSAYDAETQLAQREEEFEERSQLSRKVQTINSQAKALRDQVETLQTAVADADARLTIMENVLLARVKSVPGILRALQGAMNDDVVINGISENYSSTGIYQVSGWALTDTSAQLFMNRLDRNVERWQLNVVDESVARANGPMDLDGYRIQLRIVPQGEAEVAGGNGSPKAGERKP